MQYAQSSHHYAIHPFFLVLSAVLHLVVVTVVVQYSRHHAPPPPVNEIIEVTMFELPAPEPIVAPPPTPEPIVEPPTPEPIVEPPPQRNVPKTVGASAGRAGISAKRQRYGNLCSLIDELHEGF